MRVERDVPHGLHEELEVAAHPLGLSRASEGAHPLSALPSEP